MDFLKVKSVCSGCPHVGWSMAMHNFICNKKKVELIYSNLGSDCSFFPPIWKKFPEEDYEIYSRTNSQNRSPFEG
jgi:hypothetical protein